ncbi:hypothetical protein PHSY_005979 [Pseudozyma hubeiensis SY62]|uniref:Uncharacterized protein n=1 Tax=Pseudozyma hubeiensis (strain SY62) TaxID=1305764 RepID=R9PJX1_PSEHS|nr:hypothetical protein PHSY_005979 [Pseudozyma hubeiensis SY62]GAC98385.1 hypothetical protein PHSY_005979 [Pseudozyma hubeiensis SY62]
MVEVKLAKSTDISEIQMALWSPFQLTSSVTFRDGDTRNNGSCSLFASLPPHNKGTRASQFCDQFTQCERTRRNADPENSHPPRGCNHPSVAIRGIFGTTPARHPSTALNMSSDDVDAKVMGPTLEIDDSCRSGFGKLPTELLFHIIRLAASTDHKTAHACAYVSKLVCRWTAPDRWRTIICTDGNQFDALWFLLEVHLTTPATDPPNDVKRFTSLPSLQPGAFVESLFIDTSDAAYTLADILAEQEDTVLCMAASCPRLTSQSKLICGEGHRPHEVQDILRHFPFVNYLALGHMEAQNLRLDTISPVKMLCTAANEGPLIHTIDQMGPYLSNDFEDPPYVDDALWRADGSRIWKPSLESFRRRLNSVHFVAIDLTNKISGVTMPIQAIETLRSGSFGNFSFVRRIADHQAGGPPPRLSLADQEDALASEWYIWPAEDRKGGRRYTRGSDPPLASSSARLRTEKTQNLEADEEHGLHPFDNEYSRISSKSWNAFHQGVTKIRYDTRKFAFRPCEITASRLKPFFEELTTTGVESTEMNGDEGNASTSSFTHSGPRHAAPHRGAGHYSKPDPGSQSGRTNLTAKQAALNTFGCNKFETLHLCWDPVPGTDDNGGTTALQRSSDAQTSSTFPGAGGDADWPVERQDIWTNTLSQNNEAQAPPPHTLQNGSTRATSSRSIASPPPAIATTQRASWAIPSSIESKQSKNFRADLIDSIRTTIGWTRQDQQLLSDTPLLSNPSDVLRRFGGDQARYSRFENIVTEIALQQNSIAAQTAFDAESVARVAPDHEKLTTRLVPPAERLRLGGMYVPYTKQQRVSWFLANLDTDDA